MTTIWTSYNRTTTLRAGSTPGSPEAPPPSTCVENEIMVLDGCIEPFVLLRSGQVPLSDIRELRPLLEDARGVLAQARQRLESGEAGFEVDLVPETGTTWEAFRTERGEIELESTSGQREERVVVGSDPSYVRLEVTPVAMVDGWNCKQVVQGRSVGGQIVCLYESIEEGATDRLRVR